MTETPADELRSEGDAVDEGPTLLARFFSGLLGLALMVAFGIGIVWLAIAMLPSKSPPLGKNPNWLDYLIDNRWVIWVFRLSGLLAAAMFLFFAVYFSRSIVHRIRKGHWLESGGPFRAEIVKEAEERYEEASDTYRELWEDAEQRAEALETQLGETNQLVEALYADYQTALAEIERLAGAGSG